jgi:molecular chaperone HtpG
MAEGQDRIYFILGDSYETAAGSPHLEQLCDKGLEVLLLSDRIDPWVIEHLTEFDGKQFKDVGRGKLSLPDSDGEMTQDAVNEEYKAFLKKIRRTLKDKVETVNVSQRLVDSPACVVTSEQDLSPQMRRMLEASGQALPETKPVLEINIDHPLVSRLAEESDNDRFGELSQIVLDHALLAEGAQLENPADYVRRMNKYLVDLEAS